jgi:hypothetical protein
VLAPAFELKPEPEPEPEDAGETGEAGVVVELGCGTGAGAGRATAVVNTFANGATLGSGSTRRASGPGVESAVVGVVAAVAIDVRRSELAVESTPEVLEVEPVSDSAGRSPCPCVGVSVWRDEPEPADARMLKSLATLERNGGGVPS